MCSYSEGIMRLRVLHHRGWGAKHNTTFIAIPKWLRPSPVFMGIVKRKGVCMITERQEGVVDEWYFYKQTLILRKTVVQTRLFYRSAQSRILKTWRIFMCCLLLTKIFGGYSSARCFVSLLKFPYDNNKKKSCEFINSSLN